MQGEDVNGRGVPFASRTVPTAAQTLLMHDVLFGVSPLDAVSFVAVPLALFSLRAPLASSPRLVRPPFRRLVPSGLVKPHWCTVTVASP
jgi:hypothetical protein